MMNNLVSELEAFGLTTQESQVYLNLLQSPSQTALSLSRSLPINRTTLYRLLEHLSRLGLVEEILDHKTTRYSASPPEKLKLVLQNKQIAIDNLHQSLASLLPNLQQLESSSPSPTKILYYRGVDGLKQLLYNTLSATDEVVGYGYLDWNQGVDLPYAEFLRQEYLNRQIINKEISNDPNLNSSFTKNKDYFAKYYQHRFIPKTKLALNHDTYIYNDIFAFYHIFNHEYFGVEVKNQEIAATQKQIFYLLWGLASNSTSTPDSYFGFLSKTDKETGDEFVNRLRRSPKEKTYTKNSLALPRPSSPVKGRWPKAGGV